MLSPKLIILSVLLKITSALFLQTDIHGSREWQRGTFGCRKEVAQGTATNETTHETKLTADQRWN
jgi:hypothetical protein